jgi:hypothetical protein
MENDLGFSIGFDDIDKYLRDVARIEKETTGMANDVMKEMEKVPAAATKTLRAQIREAQNMAVAASEAYGDYSEEAIAAYKEVARLKDKQEDLNRFIEFLNPNKFDAIAKIAGGLAGGLQLASGAMGLLGVEGENATRVMAKLQAAANLAQGLKSVEELQKAVQFTAKLVNDNLIQAFKAMGTAGKAAVAGTGIGLLAIAIGAVVSNWDSWFGSQKKVNEEMQKFIDINKKAIEGTGDRIGQLISEKTEINSLVKSAIDNTKSKDEQKAAIDRLNKSHPEFLKGLKEENITTEELTKRLNAYNKSFNERIKLIVLEGAVQATREKISEATKTLLESELALTQHLTYQNSAVYQSGIGLESFTKAKDQLTQKTIDSKNQIFGFAKVLDQLTGLMPETTNEFDKLVDSEVRAGKAADEFSKLIQFKPGTSGIENFVDQMDALQSIMNQMNADMDARIAAGTDPVWNELMGIPTEKEIADAEQRLRDANARITAIQQQLTQERIAQLSTLSGQVRDVWKNLFVPKDISPEEQLAKLQDGLKNVEDGFRQLGQAIKAHAINTMGQFAESIGYAASGMGDFKQAFKDMLKGILPEVLKLAGMAMLNMAANPETPFPLNLALLGGGLLLLGLSGLTRGLIEGGKKNKPGQQNQRPGFQSPGANTPAPGNGLGGFNTGDFAGLNVENLTLVVDGGGFKRTVLSVIQTDTELKGH